VTGIDFDLVCRISGVPISSSSRRDDAGPAPPKSRHSTRPIPPSVKTKLSPKGFRRRRKYGMLTNIMRVSPSSETAVISPSCNKFQISMRLSIGLVFRLAAIQRFHKLILFLSNILSIKILRFLRATFYCLGSTRALACSGGRLVRRLFDARRVEPHSRRVRSPFLHARQFYLNKLKIAAAARPAAPGSPSEEMILASCALIFVRRDSSCNNSSAAREIFSGVASPWTNSG